MDLSPTARRVLVIGAVAAASLGVAAPARAAPTHPGLPITERGTGGGQQRNRNQDPILAAPPNHVPAVQGGPA
jgi:hypothetical protein